ncbi:30S ribosomal protein S14 [Bifidobacterium catulorum]|uniref:Small ribosomal subunit protein uS14 n=1 Tax=Bifidobacterium catulorum TaxID=1630173 RepID=A0A2U2MS24_9BIFI|nr:30S ribosomal protein S14 [Bifidobacterium catulorum]PWG59665.1 30S ribosomal protein S14 [Bifidobacterium catulorum]
MAKTSKIARQRQRERIVAKYAERRAELKKASVDPHISEAERESAMKALHALPRNASPTRLRNRDSIDGRPRGYLRRFGVSRVRMRELAHAGNLPGVTKSSW